MKVHELVGAVGIWTEWVHQTLSEYCRHKNSIRAMGAFSNSNSTISVIVWPLQMGVWWCVNSNPKEFLVPFCNHGQNKDPPQHNRNQAIDNVVDCRPTWSRRQFVYTCGVVSSITLKMVKRMLSHGFEAKTTGFIKEKSSLPCVVWKKTFIGLINAILSAICF